MPTFNDQLNINGNNYSRINTIIELSSVSFGTYDITQYVKGISYSQTQVKEFDYTLGSHNRPSHFGVGNITCEGTLTLTDAGLDFLNSVAVSGAVPVPSMLYLGQDGVGMSITVSYTTYNDKTKTDLLEYVHFLGYANGVNKDDVLYSREVALMIGKVNIGGIV